MIFAPPPVSHKSAVKFLCIYATFEFDGLNTNTNVLSKLTNSVLKLLELIIFGLVLLLVFLKWAKY